MKESTLHQKLENIVREGKPKTIRHEGKTYYISKKKIRECEKEGGILPLLTLIPLISGGVSAAGGVAGAAAGIAKAVNDKKAAEVVVICRFWDTFPFGSYIRSKLYQSPSRDSFKKISLHSMTPPKTLFGKRVHSMTPPQNSLKKFHKLHSMTPTPSSPKKKIEKQFKEIYPK